MTDSTPVATLSRQSWPLSSFPASDWEKRPKLILAYEVAFDSDADLRCIKRARIDMARPQDFPVHLAELAKGSMSATIKWENPRFLRNHYQGSNGKWPRSLSIGMRNDTAGADNFAYIVILLKDSVRKVRFATDGDAFSAGTSDAQSYLFEPKVVAVVNDNGVELQDRQAEVGTANAPRGMACFIVDRRDHPLNIDDLPFNIHLEVLGKMGNVDYITPIIIDPDIRWPPEGGGIPTYP